LLILISRLPQKRCKTLPMVLINKYHVAPVHSAMEALGMSNTQMLETGKLAMAIDGSWALSWLYKISPLGHGLCCRVWRQRPAQTCRRTLHSGFASTKHPEAAWEWVRFLSTPFYQTQFCKIGLWLPSQSELMTETRSCRVGSPKAYTRKATSTFPTKFLPQYGRVLYQPPGWAEASQILQPGFDKLFVGDATAEQAMAEVVPDANAVLQEAAQG
jgi:multiple sugar transport system substrate-binding protein